MINRRLVLAGVAALAFTSSASAEDWKAKYPEITFAVIPAENGSGVTERFGPFVNYLSRELGVKVTLRVANDYAAVIEGQRAGNIQIGYYGPASFARARLTGVKTDAFVIDVNSDGSKGYYSVFYVLAKSPYRKLEDLKGKNLGLVDPNSTSGNNMPRFKMNQMGIDPEKFFAQVVFTGSHENAVLALAQGTVDVAANGLDGLQMASSLAVDLVILDRMLPKLDGLALVQSLRATGRKMPVLILSALGDVDDRITGLRAGGDDYLTKPYHMPELLARIDALARRGDSNSAEVQTKLRLADLELDRMTRRVTRNGKKIELTAREFQLLEFMMRHSGQVVTRTMLLEGVWDYHFDPQTNVIDVHISRLRQAIDKDFNKPLLHTVRGAGYSLREDE